MKVLVTGGAGFIGSHIVDRLVNMGEVTVYDNLSSGRWEFIQHHMGRPGFCFVEADLLDVETLKQVVKGHDVVFHMAANPDIRNGIDKTFLDLEQGTVATYNVLEAMRQGGVCRIVVASSSTVYGETPPVPVTEDYPDRAVVGTETEVLVTIINQEHETVNYRIQVKINDVEDSDIGPLQLEHQEKWEGTVRFSMNKAGDNQLVEFLLYRDDESEPYLEPLHLWIDVRG